MSTITICLSCGESTDDDAWGQCGHCYGQKNGGPLVTRQELGDGFSYYEPPGMQLDAKGEPMNKNDTTDDDGRAAVALLRKSVGRDLDRDLRIADDCAREAAKRQHPVGYSDSDTGDEAVALLHAGMNSK